MTRHAVRNEEQPAYGKSTLASDDAIIAEALEILHDRVRRMSDVLSDPDTVKQYLCLHMGHLEHEEFGVVYLDTRHRVIDMGSLFRGTINSTTVHPREVVKEALLHSAAAVILYHNHPSGVPEPSYADRNITTRLTDALSTVEVRVLDHIVVAGDEAVAFSERGWI